MRVDKYAHVMHPNECHARLRRRNKHTYFDLKSQYDMISVKEHVHTRACVRVCVCVCVCVSQKYMSSETPLRPSYR